MRTYVKTVLRGCGALIALVSCGGEADPVVVPTPSASGGPPEIRSVAVVPPAIPLGGTARVNVDAFDPEGSVLVCRFAAEAGQVAVADPTHQPCTGTYTNDGTARTTDTITVTVTNTANVSARATASVSLTSASAPPVPGPGPTPRPTPAPSPQPSPEPAPPIVTTQPASGITVTGATLNGTVDGRGAPATYHFLYGIPPGYDDATPEKDVSPGISAVAVNEAVSGLTCGTTYNYRVVGTNVGGQTPGANAMFTTTACPPTVTVSSSGNCHPACTVTFTATTTHATSVTWSGCASGSGNQATCPLTSLGTIVATATATGPGGTAQASASANGINASPTVFCLGNYYFPADTDHPILYAIDDPDDPASTGTGSATYDLGHVYGAGFRPGGTQNIWEVGIRVGFGHGTVSLTYRDRWGAQSVGHCPVTGTE